MTEAPTDPLGPSFDFGVNFESAGKRVLTEKAERQALVARQLPFCHQLLDDWLVSILPNDLILMGAATGAGKTEYARIIASSNARNGKRAFYFALEAEHAELERRLKYAVICELAIENNIQRSWEINYKDWYRGKCDEIIGPLNSEADKIIQTDYKTLFTYYRKASFNHVEMRRLFLAIQSQADLIVIDHLHYIDIDDENENRGLKQIISMIRQVQMDIGIAVILIAHLRKRDGRSKDLVPDVEHFHGSSDIIKIATAAVMLAPAKALPSKKPGIANTFIQVVKDRAEGTTGLIALCEFDRRLKSYAKHYTLGRQVDDGFEGLAIEHVPRWAKQNHRPLPAQFGHGGHP